MFLAHNICLNWVRDDYFKRKGSELIQSCVVYLSIILILFMNKTKAFFFVRIRQFLLTLDTIDILCSVYSNLHEKT